MKHSNFISALLFAALLLVSVGNALAQGSAATDREALVELYDATDGANWKGIRNWKTTAPIEKWYGVYYASAGRVVNLNLYGNRLSGAIPASLGNLTELRDLVLGFNRLSGAIPASLGNLTNLCCLSLHNNRLSGTIPASLGNLTELLELQLWGNQLTGKIPAELGQLTQLRNLGLGSNQLTGEIPTWLGQLTQLAGLNLGNNQLTGEIPAELGQLTQLTDLNLGGNQLSGTIPASLGNLIRLTELDLYGNRLSGTIPASLGNLIDLEYLSLDTDTGLCLAHDFPLTSMFARLAQAHTPPIAVCNGETPDGPTPEVFTLDFAHFANGDGITSDLVFVNVGTHPIRPALYFYDKEGHLIAAESVVDITVDLEILEDGGLTVLTEMEPLGELTVSTHGRGELVSGSVRVAADEPSGGVLRFDLPGIGVAGVGASPPVRDVLFPVRRQEGGINTGVAIHNLESSPEIVRCELMQGGTVLDDVSIPLAANGQSSWFIDAAFTAADTSGFVGSVRCDAVGTGMFTAVALELDAVNRIFTTLPVVPVPERMSQE